MAVAEAPLSKEIIRTILASMMGGVVVASAGWILLLQDIKIEQRVEAERIAKLEVKVTSNATNANQNAFELVRQAGTDQMMLQRLNQIEHKVDKLAEKFDAVYDGMAPWQGEVSPRNGKRR